MEERDRGDRGGFDAIRVVDATENNLKHVSVEIPKHLITAVTGVSGSGKSSLVLDTIAAQSRRELNDTFPPFVQQYLPKYGRPYVGAIEHLPVSIVIDQKKPTANMRSTVGTYTDTYALLRLLFSRVGKPFVGYSDTFSFNHPDGCCPRCEGLGRIDELDVHKLVDFDKCLNDPGVINYVAFEPGQWRWVRYAESGYFDLDKKIRDYSPEELELFLNQPPIKPAHPTPRWPKSAKYEGLVHRMYRSVLKSEEGKRHRDILDPMTVRGVCPDCHGTRVNERVRSCRIDGVNIAEACAMPIVDLARWVEGIDAPLAVDIKRALGARLASLVNVGLGYLTLERSSGSLSGGEAQRSKIAKYLNASLSDVVYILDEPSAGLHSHDIGLMRAAVERLRDVGNTVILVEHHREMIEAADHIIDMGPAAGAAGGQVLFEGAYAELAQADTPTGRALRHRAAFKERVRPARATFAVEHAALHNLKDVSVELPLGVLCAICGVAGSGKTSLMQVFAEAFGPGVVMIDQKAPGTSARSTPGTYLGVADSIRKLFARATGKHASLFSFNGEGACPVCHGKGVISSNMSFMDVIETPCEACGGLRYSEEALAVEVRGKNVAEVMDMTAAQAIAWFSEPWEDARAAKLAQGIVEALAPLERVGLSYLHLNQALSTLSGGELQRLKLAAHLGDAGEVFILDEPTAGLSLADVGNLVGVFDALVDAGNSVFAIEHCLEVIKAADYAVELGPAGGEAGGRVLFAGAPRDMPACAASITGRYL